MTTDLHELEKKLWISTDQLQANSKLKASEYTTPVLGLIFLRYADYRSGAVERELRGKAWTPRVFAKEDYISRGVIYVPPAARFSFFLNLMDDERLGPAVDEAMRMIEAENPELSGVLPQSYHKFEKELLGGLLSLFSEIPPGITGDFFGRIYEYFLGNFAIKEGQKGGEFFTPSSLVQLIVTIMEPYHGRILDPACGTGSMFVQSARFVEKRQKNPNEEIFIYGQEKVTETIRICKMNLAVHGLSGDIRQGNTFYENLHHSPRGFDFVMANPPFNVDGVDKERLKDDPRYPFGLPKVDNANYLWIQEFYSALNETGRSGFIMPNSASDARGSEQEIRRQLIETRAVDVIIAIGSNFFYNVTLPCTLWFLDKGKSNPVRRDRILFIDARGVFSRLDRAHRGFSAEQIAFLADVVRLYRANGPVAPPELLPSLRDIFPEGIYRDIPGFCKAADLQEVATLKWTLNPGRYVGAPEKKPGEDVFATQFQALHVELARLNTAARALELQVMENMPRLLEGMDRNP